jgi:hypothetical protein
VPEIEEVAGLALGFQHIRVDDLAPDQEFRGFISRYRTEPLRYVR